MGYFSKGKTFVATGFGAVFGGLSVFYGVKSIYGYPVSHWDPNWDKRQPDSLVKPEKSDDPIKQNEYNEKLKKTRSKASRHIILIRHGQYNLAGLTDVERKLTTLGFQKVARNHRISIFRKKQALATGERLKELRYPYTSIVRSTMTRATQTAEFIQKFLPQVPVKDCSMLEEGAPCIPEPKHSHWKPELYVFRDGTRIEAAFRKYIHRAPPEQIDDTYDILVCHGNVIRYFVCRALQLPSNAWLRLSINHASITWICIRPDGKVSLRTYSDVGHMPPDYITTN